VKRLLALLVVLGGALAAAAFTLPSDAATVDGHGISTDTLNGDLSAIDASPSYQCYLQASVLLDSQGQAQLPALSGVRPAGGDGAMGQYGSAFVRYWLSRMVTSAVVAEQAGARHLTVTDAQAAAARAETGQIVGGTFATLEQDGVQPNCSPVPSGADVLASLPGPFVDALARAQAASDLLAASAVGSDLSTGSMARYFAAHRHDFDTVCVQGFSLPSAAAGPLRAAIESGLPFAKAVPAGATMQHACFSPAGANYRAISAAVGQLAVGDVSAPVPSGSGASYLLELTGRTPATLAGSHAVLRGAIVNAGLARADHLLAAAERRAHVSVDPRYGRWTISRASAGVAPAVSPPPSSLLSPLANLPGAGAPGAPGATG
jgi:hypothetical protein